MPACEDYDEIGLVRELADELAIPESARLPVRRVDVAADPTVSALQWGSDEPQVVLLHGGGQTAHTWDATLLYLGVPGVAIDLPGHGRSSWFDDPSYLPRTMVPPLARTIEQLAPHAAVVVGMSIGGITGIALARARRELVRRLVIVDASPGVTPERTQPIVDFVTRARFSSLDELVDHISRYRPDNPRSAVRRAVLHSARQSDDGAWEWRADRREASFGDRLDAVFADLPSYWDDLRHLGCPITLVRGGRSPVVTSGDIATYRQNAPQIDVVELRDAGHNVQGDDPEGLARVLRTLLARAIPQTDARLVEPFQHARGGMPCRKS